jgi:L-lactate dehydrogenase (cytochrome)
MVMSSKLTACINIADLRLLAQRKLPRPIFDNMDGGAEDELTKRRNTSAFDDDRLVPRYLVDVGTVSVETEVLGQKIAMPVFCSPTGSSRFYHPQGEILVARAAAAAGTIYSLSTLSSYSLEDVAAASAGPKVFQLYVFRDRGVTREFMDRAKAAGYRALCLTVDTAVLGNREQERRSGLTLPIKLNGRSLRDFALRPGWILGNALKGSMSFPNLEAASGSRGIVAQTRFVAEQIDPSVTWKDAEAMRRLWDGPFAIKGIVSPEDARRAADIGASAVMVSNHGGRQLDGAVASVEMLPEVVEAVGDRVEVILDGGIRRGVHVLKALALGARACMVGRPYLYGLAAGGEAGVRLVFDILRSELVTAMKLSGCTEAKRVEPGLLKGRGIGSGHNQASGQSVGMLNSAQMRTRV